MKTLAQQYRECQEESAIDGSVLVLSNGSSADGYLEHFTEAPEIE